MSSRSNTFGSADVSWPRAKKAMPLFLLLWGGVILLGLLCFFSLRGYLQQIERDETARLLSDTLRRSGAERSLLRIRRSGAASFVFPGSHDNLLSQGLGLGFLRIVHGGDQVLLVGIRGEGLSFAALGSLSPKQSGVWLRLPGDQTKKLPVMTIITHELAEGVLLQAGKNGQESWELYRRIYYSFLLFFFLSALLLWPLSLYVIKASFAPLLTTRKTVAELAGQSQTGLLPEFGNGPEFDQLYAEINALLRRNRQLVVEMQHSLDNVAHDLRTPMTRLRSVAEYGLQEEKPEQLREALSDCLEEAEQVLAMLRVMMNVVEAEAGTLRLELADVDLRVSLERAIILYEYVAEEKKISVELIAAEALPCKADETRITQVWANLIDNALKYGVEGGWVRISAQRLGKELVLLVADNGMGISRSEQERIWERLYRGDRSRTEKGLGLGLNYVKAVVEAHGGQVSVTSELKNGALFEVRLPVSSTLLEA